MKFMGERLGSLELPLQRTNNGQLIQLKVIVSTLDDTSLESRHRLNHACSDGATEECSTPILVAATFPYVTWLVAASLLTPLLFSPGPLLCMCIYIFLPPLIRTLVPA